MVQVTVQLVCSPPSPAPYFTTATEFRFFWLVALRNKTNPFIELSTSLLFTHIGQTLSEPFSSKDTTPFSWRHGLPFAQFFSRGRERGTSI